MKPETQQSKELLILRHGKSDWGGNGDDFYRPLKKRGVQGAKSLGRWLQQQNLVPDYVLSSLATRALTTAEHLVKAMGLKHKKIIPQEHLYMAGSKTLQKALQECPPDAKRVLIVGHNPGLEELLTDLVSKTIAMPYDGKLLPTATLAYLSLSCAWSELKPGCATLISITRAADLD